MLVYLDRKWVKGTGRATRKQAGSLKSYCISRLRLAPTSGSRSSRTVSSCFSSVSDRLPRSSSSSRSLYSPKSFLNGSAMTHTAGSHVIGLLLIAVEGRNNKFYLVASSIVGEREMPGPLSYVLHHIITTLLFREFMPSLVCLCRKIINRNGKYENQ